MVLPGDLLHLLGQCGQLFTVALVSSGDLQSQQVTQCSDGDVHLKPLRRLAPS